MNDITLSHFTAEPFALDREWQYDQQSRYGGYGKPRGLWLSDESDHGWKAWCTSEDWGVETLTHETRFTLAPSHNVLIIDTPEALIEFDQRYGDGDRYMRNIDWASIIEQYDGIIITPHQWELRLDMLWYSAWDCASGCIWNLDAVVEHE